MRKTRYLQQIRAKFFSLKSQPKLVLLCIEKFRAIFTLLTGIPDSIELFLPTRMTIIAPYITTQLSEWPYNIRPKYRFLLLQLCHSPSRLLPKSIRIRHVYYAVQQQSCRYANDTTQRQILFSKTQHELTWAALIRSVAPIKVRFQSYIRHFRPLNLKKTGPEINKPLNR